MLGPDRDGVHHPTSEAEIQELVRWAGARGLPLRVRGAQHSVPDAIHTSAHRAGRPSEGVDLALDRYADVRFDVERRQVEVQAGCRFGADPRDASGRASLEAGLCWQLEQRGWALPNLAGVTQQTVAGFLMTGSSGGSHRHSVDEAVVGMRLVDANGDVLELSREREPELFDAAGVSLGVLGVVSTVTLQCVERYDVEGTEEAFAVELAPFDLCADGRGGVDGFLRDAEYARLLWWPQPGVDKVVVWTARRLPGPPTLAPVPYRALPSVAGSTLPAQAAAGALLAAAGRRRRFGRALATAYNAFLSEGAGCAFRDSWWRALPMDDQIDERMLPTGFTELWIPSEATGEALRRLRGHFARGGYGATGSFSVELYAGRRSRFWLSPGHERDATRLNFFWLERNAGDPRAFFAQFWDLLADLDFRLHWGKHLFGDPGRSAAHLAGSYARWQDFLDVREQLDPSGAFLSDYWRAHLGVRARPRALAASPPAPGESSARLPAQRRGPRLPLLFRLSPSGPEYARRAPYVIDVERAMEGPPELLYDELVELGHAREWLLYFVRKDGVRDGGDGREPVMDEVFRFMTLRVRTIHGERGRRWLASVDACTLPLGPAMYEDVELTPLPDGRTLFRWRIHYEPYAWMKPFHPLVRRFFVHMFRTSLERLDRFAAARARRGAA